MMSQNKITQLADLLKSIVIFHICNATNHLILTKFCCYAQSLGHWTCQEECKQAFIYMLLCFCKISEKPLNSFTLH